MGKEKCVWLIGYSLTWREVKAGAEAETAKEPCLLALHSHCLPLSLPLPIPGSLTYLPSTAQDQLHRDGAAQSGLGPPISISNQGDAPQTNPKDTILQLRISLPQYAGLRQLTRIKQWRVQYLEGTDGKTYSTLGSVCQEGFLGKGRTPQSESCEGASTIHAHLYGRDAENIVGEPPALSFSQWTRAAF